MSLGISTNNIHKAHKDLDNWAILPVAEREKNIAGSDGVTLNIIQETSFDWLINTIDGRRIKLEKQAEILHDYYGDRLLAKDLFKDYLSHKKWSGGIANILSFGLIGANLYTRVMKNSIFMGKVGTLASIIAIQAIGRNCSNNLLENHIKNPWNIHLNRMSKGLGPTNVPHNHHEEILTTPMRFNV
jgi:hypothetical protein